MIGSWALILIIEGHALDKLLGDVPNPIVEEILHSFASSCDAVIDCRVILGQQTELVKLIRTLAIGDGEKDVDIIQELVWELVDLKGNEQ